MIREFVQYKTIVCCCCCLLRFPLWETLEWLDFSQTSCMLVLFYLFGNWCTSSIFRLLYFSIESSYWFSSWILPISHFLFSLWVSWRHVRCMWDFCLLSCHLCTTFSALPSFPLCISCSAIFSPVRSFSLWIFLNCYLTCTVRF